MHQMQSFSRQVVARSLSNFIPYYIINEFPKSGGTWLCQMLAESLQIPNIRHRFPLFQSSTIHMHTMNGTGLNNIIIMWRDGRDVMTSWYHHCLFEQSHHNAKFVAQTRARFGNVDYENVYENMPKFIDFTFTHAQFPRFTWADFVRQWHGRSKVLYVRYEDLLNQPADELLRICCALKGQDTLQIETAKQIAEHYSFQNQTGRQAGNEQKKCFLRKGIAGDWKNNFSAQALEVFEFYAGKEMKLLGYQA